MDVKEASATLSRFSAFSSDVVPSGYQQTDAGIIPVEWNSMPLGDLCLKIQDGTHFSPKIGGHDYLYLTSKNIRFGFIDISTAEYVDTVQHEAIYKRCDVKQGDLLLTKDGANTGNAALNTLSDQFSLLSSVAFLRFDAKKHNAAYFLQQALSPQGQRRMKDAMSGNAITRLTLEKIRKLIFPAAPLPEQNAIAEALSDADALMESLEQLIAKKRQIKQGTMQALLTGKQRLPGFDADWRRKALSDLFAFSGGYSASREQLSEEGYCYLHYGDIHTSSKSFVDVGAEIRALPKLNIALKQINARSLLKDGDIVFVDASEDDDGTSKHVVIINKDNAPFISGLHTIVAKSKTDELDHVFRRFCFQTRDIKQQFRFYAVGTKVSGVSKSNIGKIELSFPPIAEQSAIASVLTDMDTELAELEARLAKTRQLKQGMMQELLTGRIRLV